jgi:K+ transporter
MQRVSTMRYFFYSIQYLQFNSAAVTLGFQTTANIGNAYGICVVTVFSITMHLLAVAISGESSLRIHLGRTYTQKFSLPTTTYVLDKNYRATNKNTDVTF